MILSIIKANAEIGRLEKELADLQSKLTQTEDDKEAISKAAADDVAKSVEMAKAAEADMAKAAELVKAAEALKADVEKIASQKALEIVASQGVPAAEQDKAPVNRVRELRGLDRAIAAHKAGKPISAN